MLKTTKVDEDTLYFKQKSKEKFTFQLFTMVNILEKSFSLWSIYFLFTVINMLKESCSLCSSQLNIVGKVIYRGVIIELYWG